jgi:hypothetical protein
MKKLLVLAFACLALSAQAATAPTQTGYYSKYGKVLNAVTMETARSFTKAVTSPETNGTPSLTVLWACLTDINDTISYITVACTASHDGGTTDYTMQATNSSAGVSTYSNWSGVHTMPSYPTAKCWPIRLDTAGFPEIECTFTPNTAGAAVDLLTVYLTYGSK